MTIEDIELLDVEARGVPPLPEAVSNGFVPNDGARIWFGSFGDGPSVILLHGGMGSSGNWAYQVPVLVAAGYRAITIDSRGQGRSTRDSLPYSYVQMAADTRAVMDHLGVARAAFIGWSDGADTALTLADETPERAAGVLFFACNVDPSGTKPFVFTPPIGRALDHFKKDYAALSSTPADFDLVFEAVGQMQRSQPNYSAEELGRIRVPVLSVLGENDEFIRREHAEYIARSIPGAQFVLLPGVSHFAMLQKPDLFNRVTLDFLGKVLA
ncbi:MAG: alpha/beta hydrolase [Devosia sp.]